MAQVTEAEAQRIVAHMNKDHAESLGNYLEHYGHVPRSLACASPALTSFTTASMKISYGPAKSRREWTHEFSPPMYAGEARKRLEAMHQDARKGLGISPAEVDRVVVTVPALISLVVYSSVLLAFSVPRPETIASAFSFQAQYLSPLLASIGLKRAYEPRTIGRVISLFWTGILLVAHVAEAFLCLPPLFRSYNVKSRSVQLAYVVLTVVGGFPIWQGLRDKGIEEERKLVKAQ
ncbi:hypothetical protein BMF94_0094 [Rhodotorula taiwanensis]|uniref:DUF2470 domain-containing protein n=1 Tax=Rhodotorula taiwanensis TaxID=741276 RepID=A0A2S5BJA1_9BASI|nr:hypothetical protein BMF94_0094 [Rhodotorula taiwanensis]